MSALASITSSILLPTTVSRHCRLAYDDITSSVWISNYEENLVYRYKLNDPLDSLITFTGVQDPRDIVPDPFEGGCWIATKAGIMLIVNDGSISVSYTHLTLPTIYSV